MITFGFDVEVSRSFGKDRFGNPLPGDTFTVAGCAVAPAGSSELVNGQATVLEQDTLYAPFEADIQPQDEVVIPEGQVVPPGTYQVDGRPQPWRSPFTGAGAGTVVRLTRATG